MASKEQAYDAIARNLREFGYSDVTADMIRDTDEAPDDVDPHGVISMFARRQLAEAREEGLIET